MPRLGKGAAFATAAAVVLLLLSSAGAQAATSTVAFTACPDAPGFGCAQLTVPVDPTGIIPGTVTLQIERKVAVTGTATQAIVGMAGGPGQSAIPFAEDFAQTLGDALNTRDLIVFDQRGTGMSGALSCPEFANPKINFTATQVGLCGNELGPTRGLYETDDSVADIEAIRVALGYSQLILYGTSYGTKVALRYAAEYPADTGGLLLDSTVEPDGPDVYGASSFAEIPRMLSSVCAGNACAHIGNPLSDLTTLVTRLNTQPVEAKVIGPKGQVDHVKITSDDVFNILISGDLDPVLRANLPSALHAAVHDDYALLGLLDVIANQPEGGVNDELYLATICEELPFPWTRTDPPTTRAADALAAFQAMPATTFAPFTAQTAYDESDAPNCAGWPFATAAPEANVGPLPNVPTLIISGAEDMRTPTADAQVIASEIPDSTLLVVPNTGHSVLGTEPTNCAQNAVNAFFAGTAIKQCTDDTIPSTLTPTPIPPRSLASLKSAPGTTGLPGQTVRAVLDTLDQSLEVGFDDFVDGTSISSTVRFGGLRAGWGSFSLEDLELHHYTYITGVTVTGKVDTLGTKNYTMTIAGSKAASGQLTFYVKAKKVSGILGGVAVSATAKQLDTQTYAVRASAARVTGYASAKRLAGL